MSRFSLGRTTYFHPSLFRFQQFFNRFIYELYQTENHSIRFVIIDADEYLRNTVTARPLHHQTYYLLSVYRDRA